MRRFAIAMAVTTASSPCCSPQRQAVRRVTITAARFPADAVKIGIRMRLPLIALIVGNDRDRDRRRAPHRRNDIEGTSRHERYRSPIDRISRPRSERTRQEMIRDRGFRCATPLTSALVIATLLSTACSGGNSEPSAARNNSTGESTDKASTGAAASPCTQGSGIITTVAGSWPYEGADDQGFPYWRSWGDGGPAMQAQLDLPSDVAVDASGNLYVLETSHGPGLVRKVDPSGRITTVVGPPTDSGRPAPGEASRVDLRSPWGITLDAAGNLYVGGGNGGNSMVVKVDPSGEVTTVAGTGEPGFSGDGGPATEAQLSEVRDLAFDHDGNLYISDGFNNRIRKVDPSGVITTFAGTGKRGFSGDGGPAVKAQIKDTGGIAVDTAGNVYIADTGHGRVRVVDRSGIIETVAGGGKKGRCRRRRPCHRNRSQVASEGVGGRGGEPLHRGCGFGAGQEGGSLRGHHHHRRHGGEELLGRRSAGDRGRTQPASGRDPRSGRRLVHRGVRKRSGPEGMPLVFSAIS